VLLSSAVRAEGILSTNEQIINFFILHSADGSGQTGVEFPTCAKPWTLAATKAFRFHILGMENRNEIIEPLTKAKQLIGLKNSSYKDYIGARILFLNDQLHQAAILANTCIEKEIKSFLYAIGIPHKDNHDTFKLLNLLSRHDADTAEKINSDFVKVLTKIYRSRYHEDLGAGYNFVIAKKKFLAELDDIYALLEKKVRYNSVRMGESFPKSQYELAILSNYGPVILNNFLYTNQTKEEFVTSEEIVFEFRIAHNSEVIEALYKIPKNIEPGRFLYEGLRPGKDPTKQIKLSHHYTISELIYVSRNGHLLPQK